VFASVSTGYECQRTWLVWFFRRRTALYKRQVPPENEILLQAVVEDERPDRGMNVEYVRSTASKGVSNIQCSIWG